MGKRVSDERATRGGEGRNTAVSGHRIHVVRLGKPSKPARARRLRSLGARVLGAEPRRPGAASRTTREDFQMAVGFVFLVLHKESNFF